MAATEAFVEDAVEAVLRQVVDRETAERMFREQLGRQTAKPRQGRPPDQGVNDDLLAQVEHKVAQGETLTGAIKAVAAEVRAKGEKSVSIERRIWRQLEKHDEAIKLAEEAAKRAEEARRAWAALITFRTATGEISRCADYESALAEYRKKLAPSFLDEIGNECNSADI